MPNFFWLFRTLFRAVAGSCNVGSADKFLTILYELTNANGMDLTFIANKQSTTPAGNDVLDTKLSNCFDDRGWVEIGPNTNGKIRNVTGDSSEGYIRLNSSGSPVSVEEECQN